MYVLRSMKTLSQTAIPRLYDRERVSLQERVKKAPAVCLLSTIATTSFMYITCHFIENYNMFFLVFFLLRDKNYTPVQVSAENNSPPPDKRNRNHRISPGWCLFSVHRWTESSHTVLSKTALPKAVENQKMQKK
jgi:hypothetical protein